MTRSRITLVTQPKASSGLGGYIHTALEGLGQPVDLINAFEHKLYRLGPTLRAFSLNRSRWWRQRWENTLFSSEAWRRNTRMNGKLIDQLPNPEQPILQVAKEYFPHPSYPSRPYFLYVLYNNRLSLTDGVTPWLPPAHDRAAFQALEDDLFRSARRVFVGGGYVKRNLEEAYGVPGERVVVVGGGVHPYYLDHPPGAIPDRFTDTCVFVGWDFGMKGGDVLLKAFAIARKQRPSLRLVIAGPPASSIAPQPGVEAVGPLPSRDALLALYRRADLFVMPSLRDSFGFVFLEAMSQGVPCIGCDFNAMPEIIDHGVTGLLAPLGDADALAEAILTYYRDETNRRAMGEAARIRVRERFTWPLVAQRIVEGMKVSP
jgi:glycosyltransferase involved in cell wall biosynthesis